MMLKELKNKEFRKWRNENSVHKNEKITMKQHSA
jgi:hypothetical protein